MLAALFLLAIWLDRSQPAQAPAQTYLFLLGYVAFAAAITALTWRNWWRDARLAAPAHFVDMAVFTLIVFSTNGYTSPFFLFFMLPLLSAAIRWSWRETAATALALVILYLTAGLLVSRSETFELQRFIVRSGHLMILSALVIWFGIHQRLVGLSYRIEEPGADVAEDSDPFELALHEAIGATGARSGEIIMQVPGEDRFTGLRISDGELGSVLLDRPLVRSSALRFPMLFDIRRDRALTVSAHRRRHFARASAVFDTAQAAQLRLTEGLIAEVRTGTASGWLVLQGIPAMSADYVELARELGRACGAILERDALLSAMAESAGARMRLTLARDLHDGIVQFLAGAAMRIEAIARAARSGGEILADLQALKQLIGDEQRDIRGFVSALRRDRELGLAEAAGELHALAARLSQQWSVDCSIESSGGEVPIPIPLHLDLQQLLREAVANAVRHGGADHIAVNLSAEDDLLRLEITDNGTGFARGVRSRNGGPVQPWSLKERVDKASGSMTLVSGPGRTRVSISLPLRGAAA
jgi:signal transduction histidine kinase